MLQVGFFSRRTTEQLGVEGAVDQLQALMEQLGLDAGSTLAVEIRDGALVMRPSGPTLEEMLATCTPEKMVLTEEDRQWLDNDPVGNEEI